jgi:hypothetical protein
MATTAMNTYSFSILVKEGIHPPVTMIDNGGAVFPGYAVTCTGETWPDVSKANALGDNVYGVAGLLENQDIGTVYTTDAKIPVYTTGSGAIVRMYHGLSSGDVYAGDIMCANCTDGGGHVEPLHHAIKDFIAAAAGGISVTMLGTQIKTFFSIVGRAAETLASSGTTTPIKIQLSV